MIEISKREVDRLEIIQQVNKRQMTQAQAALRLGLSVRQVKRLLKRYREEGVTGIISKHRGKCPNNVIAAEIKREAIALIKRNYSDFSPTFAHQKLCEQHGFQVSVETLRKLMISAEVWQSRARSKARIHQSRPRRSCRGELIQIDGSPHHWFEDRAAPCTLIVFIDDATNELMGLHFSPTETTQAYMETLSCYLASYGRPVSLYSDKHSIFRVNAKDCEGKLTQFSRALKTLDIEAIHANTPQAKGRVKRANKTLQDRLVKELRLLNISDMESAKQYLPSFVEDYNRRFAVPPRSDQDAHRPVLHSAQELSQILSIHHVRTLTKNLTCQFNNIEYQIQTKTKGYRLRKSKVTLCEAFNGEITILQHGKVLDYRVLQEGEAPPPIVDEKGIHYAVDQAKKNQQLRKNTKPKVDHPWRNRIIPEVRDAP